MMHLLRILIFGGMLLFSSRAQADENPAPDSLMARFTTPPPANDSLRAEQNERSERLYDSIRIRSERKPWSRALYRVLVRSNPDSVPSTEVIDEHRQLAPYAGRTIAAIRIERLQPFDADGNWFERAANTLHTQTRHRIIHRDLLFKVGEPLDPHAIMRSEQLLQSRRHISEAVIIIHPEPTDTTQVVAVVRARDSWTFDVDATVRSHGETSLGLSEANLFGRGHLVRLEANLNYRDYGYGGNVLEYVVPNAWGSFYALNFAAGRSFRTTRFQLGVQKEFLQPTDYELGATYENDKSKHRFLEQDTIDLVKDRNLNIWGGYARHFEALDASAYLGARYNHRVVTLRPEETSEHHHPALHNYDALLFGLGFYREHFYSTSMIYGYGQREYLAAGFKSELVGGYRWGEYSDDLYVGMSHSMGNYTRIGYLMGGLSVGSFLDAQSNEWEHGVLDLSLRWFSNLRRRGQSHLRHFLGISYTFGWNRMMGADEQIRFTKTDGLHLLKDPVVGTNRLVANIESVFFTPYQPYGFKVALFGFLDGGLIGYDNNIFRNDGFVSIGLGARLRNERLVFKAIQLRLGVALGPGGFAESQYIRFSSASALEQYRYRPNRPEFVAFE